MSRHPTRSRHDSTHPREHRSCVASRAALAPRRSSPRGGPIARRHAIASRCTRGRQCFGLKSAALRLVSRCAPAPICRYACREGLHWVGIPDAATLTLASVLLLVLLLFGRAARNHRHFEHCALGFGIVHLLRESTSFLSAVEPVLGIVD